MQINLNFLLQYFKFWIEIRWRSLYMSFSYFIRILKMKICRIVKIFCLDSSKGELSEAQSWPSFHGLWLDPEPFGLKKTVVLYNGLKNLVNYWDIIFSFMQKWSWPKDQSSQRKVRWWNQRHTVDNLWHSLFHSSDFKKKICTKFEQEFSLALISAWILDVSLLISTPCALHFMPLIKRYLEFETIHRSPWLCY